MLQGSIVFVILSLSCFIPLNAAQFEERPSAAAGTGFILKVSAEWVYLNASVWDPRKAVSVSGLTKADFLLLEEGTPRAIDSCLPGEAPFHLLLLLDVSASTTRFMPLLKEAAIRFTEQLKPEDRIALQTFSSETRLITPFTNNHAEVRLAVQTLKPEDNTAFYDALLTALENMAPIRGRKAIVVFSDGADNQIVDSRHGSKAGFSSVLSGIGRSDCLIYTVFLAPPPTTSSYDQVIRKARDQLEAIARETGARMYSPNKARDLNQTYGQVARDLREIYTLTFTPQKVEAAGWRELRLEVRGKPELEIRSRKGYFVDEVSSSAE
jgi:Ca-activated chloride channel homolog